MPPLEHDKYYHIFNRGNNGQDLFGSEGDYKKFLMLYEKYIDPIADTYSRVLMKNHFHVLVRIRTEEEIGFYLPLNSGRSGDSVRFKTTGTNNLTESEGPVRVVRSKTGYQGPVRVVRSKTGYQGPVRVVVSKSESEDKLSESKGPDRVTSERTIFSHPINSDRSDDSVRFNHIPDPGRHFSHLFNAYAKYYNQKYLRTGSLFERSFKRIEVNTSDYFRKLVVYIHINPFHHGFTDDFTSYPWSSYKSIISSEPTRLKRDEVINWFNDIENLKYMHQMKINYDQLNDILLE